VIFVLLIKLLHNLAISVTLLLFRCSYKILTKIYFIKCVTKAFPALFVITASNLW